MATDTETAQTNGSTRILAAYPVAKMRAALEAASPEGDDEPDKVLREAIQWALRRLPEGGEGRGRTALSDEEKALRAQQLAKAEESIREHLTTGDGTAWVEIIPTLSDWLDEVAKDGRITMTTVEGYQVPQSVVNTENVTTDDIFRAAVRMRVADQIHKVDRIKNTRHFEVVS
ncbi:MAG: hypothetical protein OXG15_07050 [Gammaproteobacteria bacterium]|nr:hypothetical protein [Gammaproteobacteria bacterium]